MALVSVKTAAQELGVSSGTLYAAVKAKRIPYVRLGDRVLLDVAKVIAAITFDPEADLETSPKLVRKAART